MSRVERNEAKYKESEAHSEKTGARIAGRILSVFGTALMVIVIAACLCLAVPRIAGYDAYVVVSGSMEPAIPVGSIVFSHKTDPAQLCEGDVIVFTDPSHGTTPITHRVVRNDTAESEIITKGDANAGEDFSPVAYADVLGKVALHVPRAGFVAVMLSSTTGRIAAVLMLLAAWLLTEIGGRIRGKA